ncbi:hypothetical protein BT96DRAFT_915477, partial [Gymnopus androsaceus JB14]|uniref:Uncharacterized protein n=1 Tax=Gymnopus androsaceus JB14 TaxID=1447944 RepID=A0A6A4HTD5_9AGAR
MRQKPAKASGEPMSTCSDGKNKSAKGQLQVGQCMGKYGSGGNRYMCIQDEDATVDAGAAVERAV